MIEKFKQALAESDNTIWNSWMKTNENSVVFDRVNFLKLGTKPIRGFNFTGVKFKNCIFDQVDFFKCQFDRAFFEGTIQSSSFIECSFKHSTFYKSNIVAVDFSRSMFNNSNFDKSTLIDINLYCASLVYCNFCNGSIKDSHVYGANVWNITIKNVKQSNLTVESHKDATGKNRYGIVTVDDIELAQFINLILNNSKVSNVINAMTSKIVLILGRFTTERKAVLDIIRNELRNCNFSPILFDFDEPFDKDVTGTVLALSQMSRFIIADLTDGTSVPWELATIIPLLRNTPLLPIILKGSKPFSMYSDMYRNKCVLKILEYENDNSIINDIPKLINGAEIKIKELSKLS